MRQTTFGKQEMMGKKTVWLQESCNVGLCFSFRLEFSLVEGRMNYQVQITPQLVAYGQELKLTYRGTEVKREWDFHRRWVESA